MVAVTRCLRFWKQVEQLAPGIDTIDLPDDVAAAWKGAVRWRINHNGARVPRRGVMDTLTTVRGVYADLIQLAHEDPGRSNSTEAVPDVGPAAGLIVIVACWEPPPDQWASGDRVDAGTERGVGATDLGGRPGSGA